MNDFDMEQSTGDPDFKIFATVLYSRALPQPPATTGSDTSKPDLESRIYLVRYHLEALLESVKAFAWPAGTDCLSQPDALSTLTFGVENEISTTYSPAPSDPSYYVVRLSFSHDGNLSIMSRPFNGFSAVKPLLFPTSLAPPLSSSLPTTASRAPSSEPSMTLYLDPTPLSPSLFTSHKTTNESHNDLARFRVGISDLSFLKADVILINTNQEVMSNGFSTPYFWRPDPETGEAVWITPDAICGGDLGPTKKWALEQAGVREGVVHMGDLKDGEEVWVSHWVFGFVRGRVSLKGMNQEPKEQE